MQWAKLDQTFRNYKHKKRTLTGGNYMAFRFRAWRGTACAINFVRAYRIAPAPARAISFTT